LILLRFLPCALAERPAACGGLPRPKSPFDSRDARGPSSLRFARVVSARLLRQRGNLHSKAASAESHAQRRGAHGARGRHGQRPCCAIEISLTGRAAKMRDQAELQSADRRFARCKSRFRINTAGQIEQRESQC